MIYKFEPILRPMVWGSELWVLSAYPERISKVSEGPCKGLTIKELVALKKGELVGESVYEAYGEEFPLLVKFIDAEADLSIQVHPDEKVAQEVHNGHGKTEMWYVIKGKENAHLYAGLSKELTPETYEKSIVDGSITGYLADHKIKRGDVFFITPGRIHAICAGAYIAEIQQTSDLTYRIFDYHRKGLDGKPRELHTDLAKNAIDYKVYPEYRTLYTRRSNDSVELVSCPYFTTDLLELDKAYRRDLSNLDSFLMVMCVGGSGSVDGVEIREGQALLVDAAQTSVFFEPDACGMTLLASYLNLRSSSSIPR